MSDKKSEDHKTAVQESRTKLDAYYEVLKIKPKKQMSRPTIDKVKKNLTKTQFEMLKIPNS